MIDEIFEKFDGAFADNTIRAYRSDFEQYSKWCEIKNISPIPATADNLAMYVDDLSHTCKSATIRRRVNSLGTVFKLSKNTDPTKDPRGCVSSEAYASQDWTIPKTSNSAYSRSFAATPLTLLERP